MFVCAEDELLKKPRGEVLVEFVRVINLNIRDFQLEIRKAVDECTGEFYYVLVCTTITTYCVLVCTTTYWYVLLCTCMYYCLLVCTL